MSNTIIGFAIADILVLASLGSFNQWVAFTVAAVCFKVILMAYLMFYKPPAKVDFTKEEYDKMMDEYQKMRATVNNIAVRMGLGR